VSHPLWDVSLTNTSNTLSQDYWWMWREWGTLEVVRQIGLSISSVGFEVLKAVGMKSSISWDTTPCILLKINRRFRGTCWLHLHGQRISQARKQHEAGRKQSSAYLLLLGVLHVRFILGSFFGPEHGGDIFLRNVSFQWTTWSYILKDRTPQYIFRSDWPVINKISHKDRS
jgi:hypothetical protein